MHVGLARLRSYMSSSVETVRKNISRPFLIQSGSGSDRTRKKSLSVVLMHYSVRNPLRMTS
jgi:hypothetical protein